MSSENTSGKDDAFWGEIPLMAIPLVIKEKALQGATVVVTRTADEAQKIHASWRFFNFGKDAMLFQGWETLPYEQFSPHIDLVSERLNALWRLRNEDAPVLIISAPELMQKVEPTEFINAHTFYLKTGNTLNIETFAANMALAGYEATNNVIAQGEFSIRGSIIDIFPMGSNLPFRVDFFDDEIESLQYFDPDNQEPTTKVDEIRILPAHEFPTGQADIETFKERFAAEVREECEECVPFKAVGKRYFGQGVEYYQPLFFKDGLVSIFDYFDKSKLNVVTVGDIFSMVDDHEKEILDRYAMAMADPHFPPLPPAHLWMSSKEIENDLMDVANLGTVVPLETDPRLPKIGVDSQAKDPLLEFERFATEFDGRMLFVAESLGRRETMREFFSNEGYKLEIFHTWPDFLAGDATLGITIASDFLGGFIHDGVAVLTESDVYHEGMRHRTRQKAKHGAFDLDYVIKDLEQISPGDPVVHANHGIGLYKGLTHEVIDGNEYEFFLISYKDGQELAVPISQLHLISRYVGSGEGDVELNSLGSNRWNKDKEKALKKAWDTAADLLALYAKRAMQTGHAVEYDKEAYDEFVKGFPYEETEDQAIAIKAVEEDMAKEEPMDRLICGDVGFGKTEVALRASFMAVYGGKQVAILVPTTLLVEQHTEVFRQRFHKFPVTIGSLSRFQSEKQREKVMEGLEKGEVDIVIGTHMLLRPNIKFKNLGLVVIDEEHRFGVRQKEQLKKLRTNVDVMTMTATPIPRTLSMAMEGLRNFSLITTPPSRRLPVKTFVQPFSSGIIREAVNRELKRGGQVFFLHNDVDNMDDMMARLEEIIPEAKIAYAHGQMRERELERVMRRFMQNEFNVLLSSTIIETGIDIPNANTIIINRADKFGLAQLHQLRGRVGRSHHQAYAYLLIPDYPSAKAKKRLEAIAMAEDLGSGFMLAMRDLEIRGAGEILGDEQAGDLMKIGLNMFSDMLKKAINDIKNNRAPDPEEALEKTIDVKIREPAFIPANYCPNVRKRLVFYKRLASAQSAEELGEVFEELMDAYGVAPDPLKALLLTHRIRLMVENHGISQVVYGSKSLSVRMGKHTDLKMDKLLKLVMKFPNTYKLEPKTNSIKVFGEFESGEEKIMVLKGLLDYLLKD